MYFDVLTQLKNAQSVGKERIKVSHSSMDEQVLGVLEKIGFVKEVKKGGRGVKKYLDITLAYNGEEGAIEGMRFVSKPSRRMYRKYSELKPVRQGFGRLILSTPEGIMTDTDAKKKKVGGEALFEIW
jgi:small subunit ribosomal protein S8